MISIKLQSTENLVRIRMVCKYWLEKNTIWPGSGKTDKNWEARINTFFTCTMYMYYMFSCIILWKCMYFHIQLNLSNDTMRKILLITLIYQGKSGV